MLPIEAREAESLFQLAPACKTTSCNGPPVAVLQLKLDYWHYTHAPEKQS